MEPVTDKAVDDFVASLPKQDEKQALAIVVVGMAGSGKTTFVSALYTYLAATLKKKVYTINLDPAVKQVPFPANIDIRDTVDYKSTMKQFGLGPNGAILTSLNLFATRFDQVLGLVAKRKDGFDYILVDTPGQIEVFNWSASGTIILDALALTVPTEIAFMVDSVQGRRAATLMSTMLYACSVLYKTKLPFVAVFTKSDLTDPTELEKMLEDVETFAKAAEEDPTYAASLWKSCSLVLNPFYQSIPRCSVAVIGDTNTLKGFDKLVMKIDELRSDYFEHYLGWVLQEKDRLQKEKAAEAEEEYKKFEQDADSDSDSSSA